MSYKFQEKFSLTIWSVALEQFGTVSVRNFLLYSLIGIIVVLLILLVRKCRKRKTHFSDVLAGILFAVYVSIILQLTLVNRESGSRIGINLDVFHGLVGTDYNLRWLMIAYAVLNCILFVPYGFILSMFSFVNERKTGIQFVLATLFSFLASMMIEMTQLITRRGYYEVQDLLLNTLGGVLGWLLFFVIYHVGTFLISGKRED